MLLSLIEIFADEIDEYRKKQILNHCYRFPCLMNLRTLNILQTTCNILNSKSDELRQ